MLRLALASADPGLGGEARASLEALARADGEAIVVAMLPAPPTWADVAACHLLIGIGPLAGDPALLDAQEGGPSGLAALWRSRLAPFAANWRAQSRAPRARAARLSAPDPAWPDQARRLAARLARAVGDAALRLDHIGSTSVPGLAAKDLIDLQVLVPDLAGAERAAALGIGAGLVRVPGLHAGEDGEGREHPEVVLVDADPERPVNVNVRPIGAPVWRAALLFRDHLRDSAEARAAYEAMKRGLSEGTGRHVDNYSAAKMPFIREALAQAESWAEATGWRP